MLGGHPVDEVNEKSGKTKLDSWIRARVCVCLSPDAQTTFNDMSVMHE